MNCPNLPLRTEGWLLCVPSGCFRTPDTPRASGLSPFRTAGGNHPRRRSAFALHTRAEVLHAQASASPSVAQEPELAYALKAARQHVQHVTADELICRDCHHPPLLLVP